MNRTERGISTKIHPKFHEQIEKQRRDFMSKNNLDRLSTVAFTGLLAKGYGLNGKKVQQKRRR